MGYKYMIIPKTTIVYSKKPSPNIGPSNLSIVINLIYVNYISKPDIIRRLNNVGKFIGEVIINQRKSYYIKPERFPFR